MTTRTLTAAIALLAAGCGSKSRGVQPTSTQCAADQLQVTVQLPGAGPHELENAVIVPLEVALASLPEIATIRTEAHGDYALLLLEPRTGIGLDALTARVLDRLAQPTTLPPEAETPTISPVSLSETELVILYGGDSPEQLAEVTSKVSRTLEQAPGIVRARLLSDPGLPIWLDLDPARLAALGVSLQAVIATARVTSARVNEPTDDGLVLRPLDQSFGSPDELLSAVVATRGDSIILLRDLAQLRTGPSTVVRFAGKPAAVLVVSRRADAGSEPPIAAMVSDALSPGMAGTRIPLAAGPGCGPSRNDMNIPRVVFVAATLTPPPGTTEAQLRSLHDRAVGVITADQLLSVIGQSVSKGYASEGTIELLSSVTTDADARALATRWAATLAAQLPSVHVAIRTPALPPLQVELGHADRQVLERAAELLTERVRTQPGLLSYSVTPVVADYSIQVDGDRAARAGLSAHEITDYLRLIRGIELGWLTTSTGLQPLRLRFVVGDYSELARLQLPTPTGALVPLSALASLELVQTPAVLYRRDQRSSYPLRLTARTPEQRAALERLLRDTLLPALEKEHPDLDAQLRP